MNDVDFHPSEPMIVSAGSDGKIFLGGKCNFSLFMLFLYPPCP